MSSLAAAAYVGGLVWAGLALAEGLARELAGWLRGDVEDQGADVKSGLAPDE